MARLTEEDKARKEAAIRAAMEQLLSGNLPPGGKVDLKTLAALGGVTRTGFYPKRNRDGTQRRGAYQHLAEEFEQRVKALRDAGKIVDPRDAQIERLKGEVAELRKRVAARDQKLAEAAEFKALAVSRLAAQHAEIEQLRETVTANARVRSLPNAPTHSAPYGSCH
ncbi:hypothetical protein JHN59_00175 [Streptomyces sp. MBT49]|uniref:hypothetical protein n=1 Tax=unclassified Streptomyces TaxID=2593676 RepID=UPI00190B7E87|nr:MULTISPECIES: hypothetical protein [unclassified Streptomyces]MBK3623292.1 hypothetical protein [Streptomyces sp. MBT49]MBK3642322.1 hypothetical protein [Streptomyces sp. MBT33]